MPKNLKNLTINDVAKIPFFKQLDVLDLKMLEDLISVSSYEKNEYIFKEGEIQDSLLFIIEGSVIVLKEIECGSQEQLEELKAPQIVGEMAFICPGPRSASAMCTTSALIAKLSASAFESIIRKNPNLAINLIRKAGEIVCSRVKKLNQHHINNIYVSSPIYIDIGCFDDE